MSVNRFFSCIVVIQTIFTLTFSLLPAPGFAKQAEPPPGYLPLQPYKLPTRPTVLDKQILDAMKKYDAAGLSAAVFNDGKLIWNGSYGWADLSTSRAVNSGTLFRVASISKMVTATALMQLYEQGKFGLDDDISQYLGYPVRNPFYPDVKITFRELLTHTSSITDNGAYDAIVSETPDLLQQVTIKDMLVPGGKYYSEATFGHYAPGTQFSYTNFGTGIVGVLVEKLAGMPFAKYCTKYIFEPLGMDAGFDVADIHGWQNIAVLYRPDDDLTGFRSTKDNYGGSKPAATAAVSALAFSPAGGLRSSSVDLAKFMQAHLNGGVYNRTRILKKDTADLMHSMQWFGNGLEGFYRQKGLNFHITDDLVPGRRLVGHSGEAYGLSGDAYFDLDNKIGFVFLMNGANLTDADPFYSVETTLATTLMTSFAPQNSNRPKQLKAKAGDTFIVVNDRKIFLQTPVVITKAGKMQHLFLPAIAAADALSASIEQTADKATFTVGRNKATLTAGQTALTLNGKKIVLPQAPYPYRGQLLVPVRELAAALNINMKLSL